MPHYPTDHVPGTFARVPGITTPKGDGYRVVLVYKNFKAAIGSAHIGLGVTAALTAKYLQAKGIFTDVWGITTLDGFKQRLEAEKHSRPHPITHVVISAPWISAPELQTWAINNSPIQFACVSHSNVGFLAADPGAFNLIREYAHVEASTLNFQLAGNSQRLACWIKETYDHDCWTIPNLYYLDKANTDPRNRASFDGSKLRIGCFGASRPLKNILSAGAAALQIARTLRVDLEFWVSSGRDEGANVNSLVQMFSGVKWASLKMNPWEEWSKFRQTIRHMDLLMQPSYTESFNVVTADGAASGVPSVVGSAIDWAPQSWVAHVDDPGDIARVGLSLLFSRTAGMDGLNALTAYNDRSYQQWLTYLMDTTPHL